VENYILPVFYRAYPDVEVELVAQPDYDRKLDAAVAADAMPDMYNQGGPAWVTPYAEAGYTLDLTPYLTEFGWGERLWPWMWDSVKFKDQHICVPTEFEMLNLYYNAPMFDENGWAIPQNYDEVVALGQEMQAQDIIPYGFGSSGSPLVHQWWWTYAFHANVGAHGVWEALTGLRPWTDDVFVEAIDRLLNLWNLRFLSDQQALGISPSDGRGLWAQGKAAMLEEGTWTLRAIDQWAGNLPWDMTQAPMWNTDVLVQPAIGCGETLQINAKSAHTDACVNFADAIFFDEPANILKWADKPGIPATYLPPMIYAESDFPPTFNPVYKETILYMVPSAQNQDFGFIAWSNWPKQTNTYLWSNLEAVYLGQMTPAEYMAGTQEAFAAEFAAGLTITDLPEPRSA
jgi:raffinose/stachyose/melibiose transport system substrate-binding protein